MSITSFMERLGAPLTNSRWSWGGTTEDDKAVVLIVWQDTTVRRDGKSYVLVLDEQYHHDREIAGEGQSLGLPERQHHLELARGGTPLYLVIARAKDPDAHPRSIMNGSYPNDILRVGGALETDADGRVYSPIVGVMKVSEFLAAGSM